MPERRLGEGQWVGVVVDAVNDPDRSGRVRVRIIGKHDDRTNIPDNALPWAQVVQPVTSAGIGRIGTAPTGLIRGSRVVGYWLDPQDQQYPVITGTIARAGDPIPNLTINGAPAVNTATGSIPAAAQNSASNPFTALNPQRPNITSIDSGEVSVYGMTYDAGVVMTDAVASRMAIPSVPTIASAPASSRQGVVDMSRAVDPMGRMSALPCFTISLVNVQAILSLINSIIGGVAAALAAALRAAILQLIQKLGIGKVLALLNQAIQASQTIRALINALNVQVCGINLINQKLFSEVDFAIASVVYELNAAAGLISAGVSAAVNIPTAAISSAATLTSSAAAQLFASIPSTPTANIPIPGGFAPPGASLVTVTPPNYIQQYYSPKTDPYPGYIRWNSSTGFGDPVYTMRNGQPNFSSASDHVRHSSTQNLLLALGPSISGGSLSLASLTSAVSAASTLTNQNAMRAMFGNGFRTTAAVAGLALLIPTVARGVQVVFQSGMQNTQLSNPNQSSQAVDNFAQQQAALARQRNELRASTRRSSQTQDPVQPVQPVPIPQQQDPYLLDRVNNEATPTTATTGVVPEQTAEAQQQLQQTPIEPPAVADMGAASPEQQAAVRAAINQPGGPNFAAPQQTPTPAPIPPPAPPAVQNQTPVGEVFSPQGTII